MADMIPDFADKALVNLTDKPSQNLGELFEAGLYYVGRNIKKKYRFDKADDEQALALHMQQQEHERQLAAITQQRVQKLFGDAIDSNIDAIMRATLQLAGGIPEPYRLRPDLNFMGNVLETAKYQDNETLQSMFAKLLASSVDARKEQHVHPSFANTLSSMTGLDAQNMSMLHEDAQDIATIGILWEKRRCRLIRFINREVLFLGNNPVDDLVRQSLSLHNLFKLGLTTHKFDTDMCVILTDTDQGFVVKKETVTRWETTQMYEERYTRRLAPFLKNAATRMRMQEELKSFQRTQRKGGYTYTAALQLGFIFLSPYGKLLMTACT